MGHNIANIGGSWQAWYADKSAWHGLGVVTAGAKTAAQVIKAVPEFRKPVETAPVFAKIGGKMIEVPDRVATHRAGSTTVLGIVSTEYEKLSDGDAVRTTEAVVKVANERRIKAAFESAFLLGKGERAGVSINLSRLTNLKVKRDPSKHEAYLFATWRHDGLGAYQCGIWRQRMDCNNMLNMALADASAKGLLVTIRHAGDLEASLEEARKTLGLVEQTMANETALMNALQDIPIAKPKLFLPGFTEYVIPNIDQPELHERAVASRKEARDMIGALFLGSNKMVGVPQSAYRAYQAVAEYGDHFRPLRIGDVPVEQAADRRFRSITEGPAADMKARALDYIRQEFEVPVLVAAK